MLGIIKALKFDHEQVILQEDILELFVLRPSVLPKNLKNKYDVNRNFQIWLKIGQRRFRPNHLRVLIDLYLRVRSRPDLRKDLLTAFDKIFYGEDPSEAVKSLAKQKYEHYLNPLSIIASLYQLFLIEQEFNYTRDSNFEPKTLFLHGWVRTFLDSPKEIDNLCMSVCRGQPPKASYVDKENKKGKKYDKNYPPLWYLEKSD